MLSGRKIAEKLGVLPPLTMIGTGLVLIAGGLIWPRMTALHGAMSDGGIDFIQGFLVGIGIACEVMGVAGMVAGRRKNRQARRS